MTQDLESLYDEVPYVSVPIQPTRPENLRAVATLHGLQAPSVSTARILELGCAMGGNLMPVAMRFPSAHCLGIDLSGNQIRDGQELVATCGGLPNLELRHASITDIDRTWGVFDYIIAHGVYSWVPDEVRDAIMRVCRENLAPNGVAMLSFNAYPGWKAREFVRDAMIFAAKDETQSDQRLAKGREMVSLLESLAEDNTAITAAVSSTREQLKGNAAYLQHEFMEPFNQPLYLTQFVDQAREQGLEYLGDADMPTMFVENYPEPMLKALDEFKPTTAVAAQQFLDFPVVRNFRMGLVTHADAIAGLTGRVGTMQGRYFYGAFENEFDEQGNPLPDVFKDQFGLQYRAENPLFLMVAEILTRVAPATLSFAQVCQAILQRVHATPAQVQDAVDGILRMMVMRGSVISPDEPNLVAPQVDEKPLVHPFERARIRLQMEQQPNKPRYDAWTLTHLNVELDPFGAWLAHHCDGNTGITALAMAAEQAVRQGLPIVPADAGTPTLAQFAQNIPRALETLRTRGILMRQ